MSRQLALTRMAPSGFLARKKSSIASTLRRGFHEAHNSEPSARMVGRNNARLRALSDCASSIQAMRKPSSDLIEFGRVILHAAEDDDSVAGRGDLVAEDLELDGRGQGPRSCFRSAAWMIARACAAPRECTPQACRARPGRSRPEARRRNAIFPSRVRRTRTCNAKARAAAQRSSRSDFQDDNDTLDTVDQFQCSLLAALDRLRRLAPAAVENGVGRRNARRHRRLGVAHDADQHVERGAGVATRQRANFGDGLGHFESASGTTSWISPG